MEEQIIKIDTGTAKVLDLDADGKGLYLAFATTDKLSQTTKTFLSIRKFNTQLFAFLITINSYLRTAER